MNDGISKVTDISSRRAHEDDVLDSVTLVFGGINYGTFRVHVPYAKGRPFALYLVAANTATTAESDLRGPLDCLITDDAALALDEAR